jgi:transposase
MAVINQEECMEIRILRRQGKSLPAIAKDVGLSINTVRKYLAQEDGPKYKTRPAIAPRPHRTHFK